MIKTYGKLFLNFILTPFVFIYNFIIKKFSFIFRFIKTTRRKIKLFVMSIVPLYNRNIPFKTYREKYKFSDLEMILFLFGLVSFFVYLIFDYFNRGIAELIDNMFFLFLIPLSLLIIFELKAKRANRKKLKVLKQRKFNAYKRLSKILMMHKDEDAVIVKNYLPVEKITIDARRYIDTDYELKQVVLSRGYKVMIGISREENLVSGYLATIRES